MTIPSASCGGDGQTARTSPGKGIIASITSQESGWGTFSSVCPWLVEVEPFQRINFTLIDFSISARLKNTEQAFGLSSCRRFGVITEGQSGNSTQEIMCGGKERERSIYLSRSNRVEVRLNSTEYFLLKYEGIKCLELIQNIHSTIASSTHLVFNVIYVQLYNFIDSHLHIIICFELQMT